MQYCDATVMQEMSDGVMNVFLAVFVMLHGADMLRFGRSLQEIFDDEGYSGGWKYAHGFAIPFIEIIIVIFFNSDNNLWK